MTSEQHEGGTRERILRIAAELFARRGYHATGVKELGEAVGLGRGALYHHIGGKEDLLYDIAREYIDDLARHARTVVADPTTGPRAKVETLSVHLIETVSRHRSELAVCFGESRSLTGERRAEVLQLHRCYERSWQEVLRAGVTAGAFRTSDPVVLKGILGMHFYSYLWLDPQGRQSPAEIATTFVDLVLGGLLTEEARAHAPGATGTPPAEPAPTPAVPSADPRTGSGLSSTT